MSQYSKYLPIGTIVTLKKATKKIMIIGFQVSGNEGKIYDYMACLYPEGIITRNQNLAFDHDQIEKIYCIGYKDEEYKKFENYLNEFINIKNK